MLTKDEWEAIEPPIYWVDLPDWANHELLIRNIIDKWCDEHVNEWWFRKYHTFAFGSERDRATFLMFFKSDVWDEGYGEVLPREDL